MEHLFPTITFLLDMEAHKQHLNPSNTLTNIHNIDCLKSFSLKFKIYEQQSCDKTSLYYLQRGHQTVPCALGSTQPLKMSTRIFLGVKTAGA
jgi:hypothetical protein